VFWNAHETDATDVGNATWEGRANLPRFISLAASHGLWVDVRIGPYICGVSHQRLKISPLLALVLATASFILGQCWLRYWSLAS